MQLLTRGRLRALMLLTILYGIGLVVAFCVDAFTESPVGNPGAIKYDALVFGVLALGTTVFLSVELLRSQRVSSSTWVSRTRFITRMLHGLLVLLAFTTFFDDKGLNALGAVVLPPVLLVSWVISELMILVVKKLGLSEFFASQYGKLRSAFESSKQIRHAIKIGAVLFVAYLLFTMFEQMISRTFIR